MIDIYLHAPTPEALTADLETVGLAASGRLIEGSHGHALTYLGPVLATPGTYDAEGNEVTAPVYLNGVYALLRCLDDALAVAVAGAAFPGGTAVVDRPEHAPAFVGGDVPDLTTAKAAACAAIDAQAERRRQAVITPGAGQSLEYQHTAEEAARAVAAPDPLDPATYLFLVAEQEALAATVGNIPLRDVAAAVLADRATWLAYGAAIKSVRRRAKLKIGAATSAAGVAVVLAGVTWPEVPA